MPDWVDILDPPAPDPPMPAVRHYGAPVVARKFYAQQVITAEQLHTIPAVEAHVWDLLRRGLAREMAAQGYEPVSDAVLEVEREDFLRNTWAYRMTCQGIESRLDTRPMPGFTLYG